MTHLIVGAHEDLTRNMLTFGWDYTRSAFETRRLEADSATSQHNGDSLPGWPEYQQGNVALVFSAIYVAPFRCTLGAWYNSSDVAAALGGNWLQFLRRALP